MHTIQFSSGNKRYVAEVTFGEKFGELRVNIFRKNEERSLMSFCGTPKNSWKRLTDSVEFVPLGVVKQGLMIFETEFAHIREKLGLQHGRPNKAKTPRPPASMGARP